MRKIINLEASCAVAGSLKRAFRTVVYLFPFLIAACGRYLPPLAPESMAPASVKNLEVSADLQNINFKWDASDRDQKGSELKTIEGYRIYRKDLVNKNDLINAEIQYQLIASVEDTHLAELKKLKDEALEAGTPRRRVKVDDNLKHFTFSDNNLKAGQEYAYQIIPFNQGGVEGEANKIVKVLFRGLTSEILLLDQAKLEVEEVE